MKKDETRDFTEEVREFSEAVGIDNKCALCDSSDELEICRYYYGLYDVELAGGWKTRSLTDIRGEGLVLCRPCIDKRSVRIAAKLLLKTLIALVLTAASVGVLGCLFAFNPFGSDDWNILVGIPVGLIGAASGWVFFLSAIYVLHFFQSEWPWFNSKVGADLRPKLTLKARTYRDSQKKIDGTKGRGASWEFITQTEHQQKYIDHLA